MGLKELFKERSNKSDRLQESLEEVQGRYRKLINHTQAIQYTHDLRGQFLSVDQEITEFLGYDRNSLLNMNIRALLASEVRHRFETYLDEIKRQGVSKGLMVVQTASGEKRILKYYNTLRTEDVTTPFVQGIAYDVTEQKQTRKTLKQLSEQLSIILKSLPIVCYIGKAEEDYGVTYITHNVKAITGFEQTDFTSKSSFWANHIHPEDAPKIFADLPQIFEKGYREHRYRWQVADGSYKWFYDYTRLIKSSDGKNYIIGMMQDITDRERVEEALKKEKDKAQTYLDVAGVLLVAINPEQKVTLINKKGCEILGYTQEEVIGKNWFDHFIPERMRKEVKTVFSSLVSGETEPVEYFENRVVTKSGEEKIIAWHNTVITDESGRILATLSSGEDITQNKQAQEALLHAAQEWRTTFDGINDFVSLLDLEGNILRCNKAMKDFVGKPFNEIINHSCWEIILGATTPIEGCPFLRMKETLHRETTILSVNDLWFNVSVDPIFDQAGRLIGAVNIISDITKRKQAEEAVTKLSQENAIMAEIGRIISSSLNIDEVYERFSEEVRKLIPFDRIMINIVNLENNTTSFAYITGIDVQGRRVGDIVPLEGTATGECVRMRSSFLFQTESMDEVVKRFPGLLPSFKSGLRSMIFVPLISKDQVIGVLSLRNTKPNAYAETDLRLAEDIGAQIAGAVANAQLFMERKRMEDALRESETKFKDLYDNAPLGYHEYDIEGRITNVNRTGLEMLRYTAEDMIGQAVWKFNVEEEVAHQQILAKLAGALPPGRNLERAYRRKDGTTLPVLIEDRLILDEKGRIKGIRSTVQDITQRKQVEEALQESEEEAKRLSQENAIMAEIGRIISSTLNIKEVYGRFAEEVCKVIPFDRVSVNVINPDRTSITVAYAFGIKVGDLQEGAVLPLDAPFIENIVSKRQGVLILPEDESELAKSYPNLVKHFRIGIRSMMTVPLISKDQVIGLLHFQSLKQNSYTELDVRLAERVGHQIAGAIANAQLYAERKQMEEALRKSEERFRDLYDYAPLGYHEYDAEGRITCVNRTDLEMLGYAAEEMIGQSMWKFNVGENSAREQILAKLAGALPPGRNLERIYRRKDGTTFPVLIEDRLILDEKGQIKGIRCTIQDITERKRAEEERESLKEQLRQSQKMEAIGKLAGGVAHDFNNLLTVIQGYSELILNSLDQSSRLRQDVQEIINASGRASSLTRQLLAFSRKQVLQPKVLDLNAHVSNMDKMLHRIIGEDIELVTLLTKDLGRIKADPGQIEQAILNLAINAKDAMPNGGKLTIETANVKLDETYARSRIGMTPGDYVMLSMSDTGVGMAPETKERIFEPFFTTKDKGKGTGLGLSTVYGIVQQSGGNIWVYSEPGPGTTFKIYLPRIEEGTESLRPAAVSTKSLQGSETVLLVEDEEMVRKLACTVLEKNGYTVFEASNGDEALDVVQGRNGNPIHLVVTDVVMPGMSGRQLADRLVSLQPELKVLYMSGYTDNAIVHHGVLDPGIAYIQKPFTPDALASKVREILDGN